MMIDESKALVPFEETDKLAKAFFGSGMFTDVKSVAQAVVKITAGGELGLGPVYSMQRLYMIEGKLGMAAETMGALIKRSGKYNYVVVKHTDQECSIDFFEGQQKVYTSTFTMKDAQRANLVKPNGGWAKYPRALLFSRALSQGARIVAPDMIGGAYTEEELRGIQPEGEVPATLPADIRVVRSVPTGMNTGVIGVPTGMDVSAVANNVDSPQGEQSVEISDSSHPWLVTCPIHGLAWESGQYGLSHKKDEGGFCNHSAALRDCPGGWAALVQQLGWDGGAANEDIKERYGGRTWSKLTAEEQVGVIEDLTKICEATKAPEEPPVT